MGTSTMSFAIPRSDKHLIAFGWGETAVKICLVQFYRSSIFVHFPYHPDSPGIVSRCDLEAGPATRTVSLVPGGAVTSHKVKYSHPVDGKAHFSQDGKIRSEVRGAGARLDLDAGQLFAIDVQGVSNMDSYATEEIKQGKHPHVLFQRKTDEEPEVAHFFASWVMFPSEAAIDATRNPIPLTKDDGSIKEGFAMAPPPGSPLLPGVLVIEARTRDRLDTDRDFCLTFTGGFDQHLADPSRDSSFLAMMYPATDVEALRNIDFVPPT